LSDHGGAWTDLGFEPFIECSRVTSATAAMINSMRYVFGHPDRPWPAILGLRRNVRVCAPGGSSRPY